MNKEDKKQFEQFKEVYEGVYDFLEGFHHINSKQLILALGAITTKISLDYSPCHLSAMNLVLSSVNQTICDRMEEEDSD